MTKTQRFIKRNSSVFLSCVSCIGVVVTAITVAKDTPKALQLIDEADENTDTELSKWDKVRIAAPAYIPAIVSGTVTIACILGINVLNKRQQASMASAYAFLDQSYKKYRRKVVELYGDEADKEIMDAIAIEESQTVYPYATGILQNTAQYLEEDYSDPILFYDSFGHRYFQASLEQVMQAEYYINRDYTLSGCVSYNNFCDFLGLTHKEEGDRIGWNLEDGIYWIDFDHRKITLKNGMKCYSIETPFGPSLLDEYV